MERVRRQMQTAGLTKLWRKVTVKAARLPLGNALTYAPLVAVLLAFYTVQLLSAMALPVGAYLFLALVLTASGVFGMKSSSPAVLIVIAGGEAAGVVAGLASPWNAVANAAPLILAATAVPLIARGRVLALSAAGARITRQQVAARLALGEKLARGATPNPADNAADPVCGPEAVVKNLLHLSKKALKCRTATFCWYDDRNDVLVPVETLSDCPELVAGASLSLKEGRLTPLKATRELLSIRYTPHVPQQIPLYRQKVSVSSVLAVPVTNNGALAGAFLFDREGPDPFFLPDNVLARKLAEVAEDALRTERRLKSAVLVSENLRQLNDAAVQFNAARSFEQVYEVAVRYAVSMAPFAAAIMAHRISPTGTEYEIVGVNRKQTSTLLGKRFDLKDSLCGLAARARSTLPANFLFERRMPQPFGPDVGIELEDGEACALIPMMVRDEAVGFLLLAEPRRKVVKDDMAPVTLFSEYCAVSLLNTEANKELERMAVSDPLTGIPNHRAFSSRIVEASQRSDRSGKPMSLLFMDIDYFKSINDQYGHAVGDTVLKGVAGCLARSIRKVDFAARYGGEEFVALLEETDSAGALIMAERLRQRVSELRFEEVTRGKGVTVSIGIATYPRDTKSVEELIALSDSALYKAKNEGRNQCQAT